LDEEIYSSKSNPKIPCVSTSTDILLSNFLGESIKLSPLVTDEGFQLYSIGSSSPGGNWKPDFLQCLSPNPWFPNELIFPPAKMRAPFEPKDLEFALANPGYQCCWRRLIFPYGSIFLKLKHIATPKSSPQSWWLRQLFTVQKGMKTFSHSKIQLKDQSYDSLIYQGTATNLPNGPFQINFTGNIPHFGTNSHRHSQSKAFRINGLTADSISISLRKKHDLENSPLASLHELAAFKHQLNSALASCDFVFASNDEDGFPSFCSSFKRPAQMRTTCGCKCRRTSKSGWLKNAWNILE